jgi:hypothetical protein
LFLIADGVSGVSIARGMSEKYPRKECTYCHQKPCICKENRPDSTLAEPDPVQTGWSMKQWQLHLHQMYGKVNESRGIYYTLIRQENERRELGYLESEVQRETMSTEAVKHEYSLELADGMAWTMANASQLGINLEEAVLDRDFPKCWLCHNKPCTCGPFNQRQVRALLPQPDRRAWD